jgi:hypothetical protein
MTDPKLNILLFIEYTETPRKCSDIRIAKQSLTVKWTFYTGKVLDSADTLHLEAQSVTYMVSD